MLTWFFRAFFSELGDRTFLLTCILAAWCPWEGPRAGDGSSFQRLMVFAGSVTALWIWISFGSLVPRALVDGGCDCILAITLLVVIPRAFIELWKSEAEEKNTQARLAAGQDKLQVPGTMGMFNSPFMGTGSASHAPDSDGPLASDYGSVVPPTSADGAEHAHKSISDGVTSAVLALVLSFTMVFSGCSGQDSWTATGRPTAPLDVVGAMLGAVVAMFFAVLSGFILERQLMDIRLNFLVTVVICTVALGSTSQAVLHLGGLEAAIHPVTLLLQRLLLRPSVQQSGHSTGSSFLHSQ